MTVFIDPTKIYSKENDPKTFVFGNELQSKLATWSIQIQPENDKLSMQEIDDKERGAVVHSDLINTKEKHISKIKCLCVYGLCKEGEATCDKCFDGYEGVLCDIRSHSYNRTGAKEKI